MGQCCAGGDDGANNVDMIRAGDHHIQRSPNKLATLMKVQANVRAYLA